MLFKHEINRLKRFLRSKSRVKASWHHISDSLQKKENIGNKKILIATSTGSNWPCSSFDSLIGVALSLRGADVSFLLCDGILPACQECDSQWISPDNLINSKIQSVCRDCYKPAYKMLKPLNINIFNYSDYITYDKLHEIRSNNVSSDDEHARAGTLRYFGIGEIRNDLHKRVYDQYFKASVISREVITNYIEKKSPDIAIIHHGIYVPQGSITSKLSKEKTKVYVWGPSYRKGTVIFSHDESYHHSMINEKQSLWNNLDFTEERETRLMNYISTKKTGANDWISYQPTIHRSKEELIKKLNLDQNKKTIGLLTNVIWDAQLHFKNSCFKSMLEWLNYTLDFFIKNDHLQLIIRIHPAEVLGTVPSNQRVYDEIINKYKVVPSNIKIILPTDDICTYLAMELCDSVLVYGTKTAIELSSLGQTVIVAGESWARGKGFTIDVKSLEHYKKILNNVENLEKIDKDRINLARKYAYHLFFRRMIPVKALREIKTFGPYQIDVGKISELEDGYDDGLDTICNAILLNKEFVYDE